MISSLLPADSPRRDGVVEDHVLLLAQTAAALPPILVHRPTMRVIDGMHRLRAAALRGQLAIEAEFFDGSEEAAFVRAVEENVLHGLPLSTADRRAAAARIMTARPQLSDRVIGAHTGLAAKTVAVLRRSTADSPQSSTRVGADGRQRPLSGADGRRRASELIAARPGASLRDIARAAGVSVGTAHDVRVRIRRGEDPIAAHPPAAHAPPGEPGGARSVVPPGKYRPGAVGPRRPGAGPADDPATRDGLSILHNLMKDPSLRHTDPGRELLRWLRAHVISAEDWPALVSAVPPHCADVVAELARQCAGTWSQFAQELGRRKHSA